MIDDTTRTRLYMGGFEFLDDEPEAFHHGEGRIVLSDSLPRFQFKIADHLGNTVVLFEDKDNSGTISTIIPQDPEDAEVVQRNLYYPFGMQLDGTWKSLTDPRADYLYNGKELEEELGLNWYSYGARHFDPAIGRFNGVDRYSDKFAFQSPFVIAANAPILFIDVNGDSIFVDNVGNITRNDNTDNYVFLQDKKGNVTQIGELGGEIDANIIYKNLLIKNGKESNRMFSPLKFRDKVRNKGDWDLKNDKNSIFGLANHTKGETIFKFDGLEFSAQDLGNHHYGIVGKAYGFFPEEFLLEQAGRAQMAAGTSKPEWQIYKESTVTSQKEGYTSTTRILLPPYGDDPRDQHMIKLGFQYYNEIKKEILR